ARYGWWNLWLLAGPVAWRVPAGLDSPEKAARSTAPCVFILAEKDNFVPPKYHEMITRAYAGQKRLLILRGKGHWDSVDSAAEGELADDLDWLWKRAWESGAPSN